MKSRSHVHTLPAAVALVVLLICSTFSDAHGEQQIGWTGNINGFIGAKLLDGEDWAPVDEQGEIGLEIDLRQQGWPVNIAVDYFYAEDDTGSFDSTLGTVSTVESTTYELDIGVRYIWDGYPRVRPFIGGGLTFARGVFELFAPGFPRVSDSDTGYGGWIGGGVCWTIRNSLNIGIEIRLSSADVSLFGVDTDAGGAHVGLLIGYHF